MAHLQNKKTSTDNFTWITKDFLCFDYPWCRWEIQGTVFHDNMFPTMSTIVTIETCPCLERQRSIRPFWCPCQAIWYLGASWPPWNSLFFLAWIIFSLFVWLPIYRDVFSWNPHDIQKRASDVRENEMQRCSSWVLPVQLDPFPSTQQTKKQDTKPTDIPNDVSIFRLLIRRHALRRLEFCLIVLIVFVHLYEASQIPYGLTLIDFGTLWLN